ncbi:MAG: CRISPR-associated endonuclease Cas2 [Saprospiraceae bacterium]|nr:CRISPR-associated endonuclease Cas2 [Candidatus Vicinibacter affinis]
MKTRIICYDIESDNVRTVLAKRLEALGFIRIQYSVFCGSHNDTQWTRCHDIVEDLLKDKMTETDKVYILQIPPVALRKMLYFGEELEIDEILGTKKVLWI